MLCSARQRLLLPLFFFLQLTRFRRRTKEAGERGGEGWMEDVCFLSRTAEGERGRGRAAPLCVEAAERERKRVCVYVYVCICVCD
jgi:hypothetical protein